MTNLIKRLFLPSAIRCTLYLRNFKSNSFHRTIYCLNSLEEKINKPTFSSTKKNVWVTSTQFTNLRRFKTTKSREAESDNKDDFTITSDDPSLSRDSKVIQFHTTSLRTDLILKSALGIARNKIEKAFYESKIRLNGRKVLKKSAAVEPGDEVDLIKAVSPRNPQHLQVARIEILQVTSKEENIQVTARRFKNLLIENYEEQPYKSTADDEN